MKKKLENIILILYGLMFIYGGLFKFFQALPMPKMIVDIQYSAIMDLGDIPWEIYLISVVEILAGILIAIPKTRALGALVILPIVIGIFLHIITLEPGILFIAIPILITELYLIFKYYNRYLYIFKEIEIQKE